MEVDGATIKHRVNAMRMITVLLAACLVTDSLAAQNEDGPKARRVSFDVASVKHNTSGSRTSSFQWSVRRLSAVNVKLETLVLHAFGVPTNIARYLLIGGISSPDENCTRDCTTQAAILRAHFDVDGTLAEDASPSNQADALRSLLAERFKLRAAREKREIPVYALTMARAGQFGPQLRRSEHDCAEWAKALRKARDQGTTISEPTDVRGRPLCTASQMSRLTEGVYLRKGAGEFSSFVELIRGDLPSLIVDRTGLTGKFEWELISAMPRLSELVPNFTEKAPTLDVALQEQLGLRLIKTTASHEVLVIESIAMPTPN